ncbi:MAG TPA: tetratricopeptide repeat protein [candidate division Zixibacteria bacterium]|nr:tetratricopeptide repeat protein [candidate division Zixibacteria bacterium]MDD4917260.1 tetratricopeptide repeat protein [candidate division Zixibacteria bacterium]MDM7973462.1 tetratricopeptide repeat protein [candidate division Zixibacteria bacterium]HOD67481.1 tetratricopeptide repeat protein [candidate division Zixibacteria bacterium]HOZ06919.1 tetratricopeptide repeat protein [candidate division Zixibacteria bacterium]
MRQPALTRLYAAATLVLVLGGCSGGMVTTKAVRVDGPPTAADSADSAAVLPADTDEQFRSLVSDGFMLYRQQRYPEAVAVLRRAVARHPDHWEPFYALGLIRCAAEDYATAEAFLSESLDLAPPDSRIRSQIHLARARNFEAQARYGRAEQSYRAALALHPESSDARDGLRRLTERPAR